MTVHVVCYKPRQESDIAMLITDGEANMCWQVAQKLHALFDDECRTLHRPRKVFRPNLTYEFANGLVFRLYDGGGLDEPLALEFLAPSMANAKQTLLAGIPKLLEATQLLDAAAIRQVERFIEPPCTAVGRIT